MLCGQRPTMWLFARGTENSGVPEAEEWGSTWQCRPVKPEIAASNSAAPAQEWKESRHPVVPGVSFV